MGIIFTLTMGKPKGDEFSGVALSAALEREHREIDEGIKAYLTGRAQGQARVEALRRAIAALRRHIYLEEALLFPPLHDAGLALPILVMLREHGEIWLTLDGLGAQLRINPEAGVMSEICRVLLEQLERHNSKEEPILYPQADCVLSAAAAAELSAFLATGSMPAGWVCARAAT